MEKKEKRLWLRMSETEFNDIKRRGEKFGSVSAMIRKSLQVFNDSSYADRELRKRLLIDMYSATQVELSRIGNNINQISRSLHILTADRNVTSAYINAVVIPQIEELKGLLINTQQQMGDIVRNTLRSDYINRKRDICGSETAK